MKRFKQFLEKLRVFINKLLKKEQVLLIEDINKKEQELKNEDDKKEFFELYQNIKSGNIAIEDLMVTDMIKIMSMMQQEIDIYDKRIKSVESEILNTETEIKMLERENEIMKKVVQN